MWSLLLQGLMQLAAWTGLVAARITLPLRQPTVSVWRNWEVVCRTGGLGAIGLSVLAAGGQVQPGSILAGIIVLIASTYCAHRAGEMEAKNDRID
tara:strand:+ start:595 stop:879 length:285 start_codon:yes stop_codon:yes gene_type:complete